jgi:hypothetical protein
LRFPLGNTPAMDEFFMKGIDKGNFSNAIYRESLDKVKEAWKELNLFYNDNKTVLNNLKLLSLGFAGEYTENVYPKAKLLDMLFFKKGNKIIKSPKLASLEI